MSQRIRVLRELGDELERIVREAPAGSPPRRRDRARGRLDRLATGAPRAVAPALGVLVVVAVVVGAVLLVRPAARNSSTAATGSGLHQLLSEYAVLRRPQTVADRSDAGAAPKLGGSEGFSAAQGPTRGHPTLGYAVRIIGLAHYRAVPEQTRVVNVDGLRVSLFVEQLVHVHTLPKATLSGNDPKGAAPEVTRARLEQMQREANAGPGYILLARVGGPTGVLVPIAPARGRGGVERASLAGPGGKIVAVVPDGVARVSWSWPRQFDADALSFLPPVTVSAAAQENVAVAAAPARFASSANATPETVVRYGADGDVLARFAAPGTPAGTDVMPANDRQTPGPETPQSRRAERDPSTPNPVVIVPAVTARGSANNGPLFFFKPLLNDRSYLLRLTGGPRPRCVKSDPGVAGGEGYVQILTEPGAPNVRGDTFEGSVPLLVIGCAGTYRLSVSVLTGRNQPYPPFGSATFTVR